MSKIIFIPGEKGAFPHYCRALQASGFVVRLCPDFAQSRICDGLLLPGGGDIFGALDETEEHLIQSFVDSGRPILGICRGMQALNVWFGGTLHDSISDHQLPQGDMVHPTQCVGPMKDLIGQTPTVNSNHHQAIAQLGKGLIPMQWADDGIIEAVYHESLPIWGVQWHPERQSFGLRRGDAADAAPLFHYFHAQMR